VSRDNVIPGVIFAVSPNDGAVSSGYGPAGGLAIV